MMEQRRHEEKRREKRNIDGEKEGSEEKKSAAGKGKYQANKEKQQNEIISHAAMGGCQTHLKNRKKEQQG